MQIDRKQILLSVLDTIDTISSKDYQIRVWILGKGPEVDDFDECCCNFFGDGDPMLKQYKEFGITESQYSIMKKFRDEFNTFADDHYWPADFINTLAWDAITYRAKEVLNEFNYRSNYIARD